MIVNQSDKNSTYSPQCYIQRARRHGVKKSTKKRVSRSRKKRHPSHGKIRGLCNNVIPFISCYLGSPKIRSVALIDSGAIRSIISRKVYDNLVSKIPNLITQKENISCTTANNTQLLLHESVILKIKVENFSWYFKFFITNDVPFPMILGCDFISYSKLILDLFNRRYFFGFKPNYKFKFEEDWKAKCSEPVNSIAVTEVADNLSHLEQSQLEGVLNEFKDVLSKKLGKTNLTEYKIRLTSTEPVRRPPYQLNPMKMEIVEEKIKKMLAEGVIEPGISNYSSPCFLVSKSSKDNLNSDSWRLVVDYRFLNKKVSLDSVPLPNIENCFHFFNGAKYFSVLDLNQAYYQIPLAKESRHLTTFCTMRNTYQFKRIPFGLATGAQALSSVLDRLFGDVKYKFVFHYLDDIVIYSKDFDSHLAHIEAVLLRLREAGFTVNPEKALFAKKQISFLGHLINQDGISIDPSRTKNIREFPTPKNQKAIARFIGMVGYFHKFIPRYAEIAAPLNDLRKKNCKFIWDETHEQAFQGLKKAISCPPILKTADFSKQFVLQTDASSTAISAVLSQEFDGIFHPIAYASKKLSQQECKYSTYELECLAAIYGMEKFRLYLQHSKFKLLTDNSALTWMLNNPKNTGRIGRWILKLLTYQFEVTHIPGRLNVVADCLSRMYQDEISTEETPESSKFEIEPLFSMVNSLKLSDFPLVFTDIRVHQDNDPFCKDILEKIDKNEEQFPYSLRKGVLVTEVRTSDQLKIVVPRILIPLVFKYYHETSIGGHLGLAKTTHKILEHFYWPGLRKDIAQLVKSCDICGRSKPSTKQNYGFLASRVDNEPLARFYCDLVGPLVKTTEGYTQILSCVDSFTKFCWLIPLRKGNTAAVIRALKSIFVNFSVPRRLVTDNATIFTSTLFRNFCFQLGIQHITTPPYYPCPNVAERVNRNLKSALIAFHAESQTRWHDCLSWLPLAFNLASHDSTGCTPFSLMFRYSPNHPLLNAWKLDEIFPERLNSGTVQIWRKARNNLLRAHTRVKERYDRRRVDVPFKTGDLVLLQAHVQSSAVNKISSKLSYRWKGPFVIKDWFSPVTVSLHDPATQNFVQKAHVSQIKMFNG